MSTDEKALIADAKSKILNKTTSLKGDERKVDLDRYVCKETLKQEVLSLYNRVPTVLLHSSEVSEPNSYQAVQTTLGSLIVSRDASGKVHVLRNACRHRGAKLVDDKGCSKRIVCPYHAWSYSTDGELSNVPGHSHCFPSLDKSENGLIEIPSVEMYGFIWMCPIAEPESDLRSLLSEHLGEMEDELSGLNTHALKVFKRTKKNWKGNWKLFAEGGFETYHFTFAHKDTIAPYFHNNTAVIDQIGNHFRVFMPTKVLTAEESPEQQALSMHDCSHTLYYFTPNMGLLVQKEHIDLIQMRPLSVDETEISISTLIPSSADLQDPQQLRHWQKNNEITNRTLDEDWTLGASIQESINDNAIPYLQYGKNEWALHAFNQVLNHLILKTKQAK